MPARTTMVEPGAPAQAGLLELLAWFSPAMPSGAFSYSHGLEWAIEAGLAGDAPGLHGYVETVLRHGSGRVDALFLHAAYRACADRAFEGRSLEKVVALAAAMHGTRELALESGAQGQALLSTLRRAWPAPALEQLARLCRRLEVEPRHACVAGVAAAAHGIPLRAAMLAFLHALAANLISAGIRLIPLGQTDGQRLTAAFAPVIALVADQALAGSLDDLGTATPVVDWCSMRHETQYTRLFRS
ncbi:MAG TPA: urease accessory protein UreF [Geminicoccaceae bacterium]|jgi:urease accessory protein|nr:urease accessory protein UreF [Geminicoccaceae bacterium]